MAVIKASNAQSAQNSDNYEENGVVSGNVATADRLMGPWTIVGHPVNPLSPLVLPLPFFC